MLLLCHTSSNTVQRGHEDFHVSPVVIGSRNGHESRLGYSGSATWRYLSTSPPFHRRAHARTGASTCIGQQGPCIYRFFLFLSFSNLRTKNEFFFRFQICERKTTSFFVFHFHKWSKKNEKRIRFCIYETSAVVTSGNRKRSAGNVLKTNSQKLRRGSGISKYLYVNIDRFGAAFYVSTI